MNDLKRIAGLVALCLATVLVLGCDDDDSDDTTDTATAGDMTTEGDATTTTTTDDDMTTTTDDDMATSTNDDMTTTTTDDMTTTADTGMDMTTTFPAPPALGTQVDRAGRSAISTALVGRFEDSATGAPKRDQYNAAERAIWGDFAGELAGSLAIYDSLDTVCGNQLLADGLDPMNPDPRYTTLAGVLSNDWLAVDTASTDCNVYFGAELGILGLVAGDCGGRTPTYDTIDVTYSALAVGGVTGVGDGVDADDVAHSGTDFPYLAAP